VAIINDRCRSCAVKSSCPIQPAGKSVIQAWQLSTPHLRLQRKYLQ
jgi:hypothetical protein